MKLISAIAIFSFAVLVWCTKFSFGQDCDIHCQTMKRIKSMMGKLGLDKRSVPGSLAGGSFGRSLESKNPGRKTNCNPECMKLGKRVIESPRDGNLREHLKIPGRLNELQRTIKGLSEKTKVKDHNHKHHRDRVHDDHDDREDHDDSEDHEDPNDHKHRNDHRHHNNHNHHNGHKHHGHKYEDHMDNNRGKKTSTMWQAFQSFMTSMYEIF